MSKYIILLFTQMRSVFNKYTMTDDECHRYYSVIITEYSWYIPLKNQNKFPNNASIDGRDIAPVRNN